MSSSCGRFIFEMPITDHTLMKHWAWKGFLLYILRAMSVYLKRLDTEPLFIKYIYV